MAHRSGHPGGTVLVELQHFWHGRQRRGAQPAARYSAIRQDTEQSALLRITRQSRYAWTRSGRDEQGRQKVSRAKETIWGNLRALQLNSRLLSRTERGRRR